MNVPRGLITIEVFDDGDAFDLVVSVRGTLTTVEVIGFMELAKLQQRDSKFRMGPTVYQAPESPAAAGEQLAEFASIPVPARRPRPFPERGGRHVES